ncbi:hypothetical protein KCP78_03655 [Salmonella enterica subsp. enterica]|nr:hypothetical protein KCP78_03655 [Salmonella enterica subsp. enterica]
MSGSQRYPYLSESGRTGDQSIVWRLNEQLITHCPFCRIEELVSTDLPDNPGTEQDRPGTELTGLLLLVESLRIPLMGGSTLAVKLIAFRLTALASRFVVQYARLIASPAADAFTPHLRFYDPKCRVFVRQLFHTGMKPRFDLYMGRIVSQRRAFQPRRRITLRLLIVVFRLQCLPWW